jgi:hypothetical protein
MGVDILENDAVQPVLIWNNSPVCSLHQVGFLLGLLFSNED